MRRLDVIAPDGVSLACYEDGNPDGPEIVFIHGFSQCSLCWAKQFSDPELVGEFRLVAFDLRGHGASDKPLDAGYYAHDKLFAADVHGVLEAAGLKRPVLAAWSYAGRIVQDYVRSFGTGRLAGINFIGARTKSEAAFDGPGTAQLREMKSPDVAANIAATRSFLRACYEVMPGPEEFEIALAYNMLVPPSVRAANLSRPPNPGDLLPKLNVPVLVAQGSEDKLVLKGLAEFTAAAVPGAKLSMYDGIGHSPFAEAPERFNRELAAFVRSCN